MDRCAGSERVHGDEGVAIMGRSEDAGKHPLPVPSEFLAPSESSSLDKYCPCLRVHIQWEEEAICGYENALPRGDVEVSLQESRVRGAREFVKEHERSCLVRALAAASERVSIVFCGEDLVRRIRRMRRDTARASAQHRAGLCRDARAGPSAATTSALLSVTMPRLLRCLQNDHIVRREDCESRVQRVEHVVQSGYGFHMRENVENRRIAVEAIATVRRRASTVAGSVVLLAWLIQDVAGRIARDVFARESITSIALAAAQFALFCKWRVLS
jgi:hypothetical protein